jgi:hypothetical protein
MPLLIRVVDPAAPVPRETELVLTCDREHGLFPAEPVTFRGRSYIEQNAAAMAAGWIESHSGGQRRFIGPCCSGKRPGSPSDDDSVRRREESRAMFRQSAE